MSGTLNDMPNRINRFPGISAPPLDDSQVTVGNVFAKVISSNARKRDVRVGRGDTL
jgi:hypothetical protein